MSIKPKLMQKNGITAVRLAQEFLSMEVGERINTVEEYSNKYNKARGTIQSAIKLLQEYGAIDIEARGHLGSFITSMDYKKLLEVSDINTLIGVMPLPYSKLYEGLATGLYKNLNDKKIPFSLAYMRGAGTRIEALQNRRYDFVIISKLAANYSINEGVDIEIITNFGEHTYVNEHVMIFKDQNKNIIEDGMKVGIDNNSIDHKILTLQECKDKKVEFVDVPYKQIIFKILKGQIDAAIINVDEIIEGKMNINYNKLINEKNKDATEAVMVTMRENKHIEDLLKKLIDKEKVIKFQNMVVKGKIMANY